MSVERSEGNLILLFLTQAYRVVSLVHTIVARTRAVIAIPRFGIGIVTVDMG
jgi:hypothetical protein